MHPLGDSLILENTSRILKAKFSKSWEKSLQPSSKQSRESEHSLCARTQMQVPRGSQARERTLPEQTIMMRAAQDQCGQCPGSRGKGRDTCLSMSLSTAQLPMSLKCAVSLSQLPNKQVTLHMNIFSFQHLYFLSFLIIYH